MLPATRLSLSAVSIFLQRQFQPFLSLARVVRYLRSPTIDAPKSLAERLKAQLLRLALPHEIVLDLHCDDESENYLYIHQAFLPEMYDLASALGSTAILSWDSTADAAFEEACAHPVLHLPEAQRKARAVTTVEFRGLNDVDIETGRADAEGLYRFLVHRGVIVDHRRRAESRFQRPCDTTRKCRDDPRAAGRHDPVPCRYRR